VVNLKIILKNKNWFTNFTKKYLKNKSGVVKCYQKQIKYFFPPHVKRIHSKNFDSFKVRGKHVGIRPPKFKKPFGNYMASLTLETCLQARILTIFGSLLVETCYEQNIKLVLVAMPFL